MKKATHNGTCQVCGALQALPDGKLSKHGYDVEFHYFRGVCPGAAFMPLEQDRTQADAVAASLMVQSRKTAKDAVCVSKGEILPKQAASGEWTRIDGRTCEVVVAFERAPAEQQRRAVAILQHNLESESKECARVAGCITDRADRVTGKQELQARVAEVRRPIVAGTRVKVGGLVRTVLRVEARVARGCGPYLNGNSMPHAVFARDDGHEYAYPLRLIRQSAIVE